ncbi:unnamed protein product [Pieris brassicae]|uniref:Uncharacterized protein n=1 Tax=Pieris brassicae TaxID=7116 RepID=A0A9P0TA99_PIEBR|nr:unnamed protein product [Pieris brassicae]
MAALLPDLDIRTVLNVVEENYEKQKLGSEDTVHRHLRFLFNREVKWIEYMKKQDEEAANTDDEDIEGIKLLEESSEPVDRKMFKRLKMLTVYHSITVRLFDDWRAITARPPSLVGKLDVFGPLAEHLEQLKICLDKIRKLCALAQDDEELSFTGLSANDPKMEALPEITLLDFLLASNHILDLRHVVHLHRRVDDYAFYFEKVWPLPTHFTPKLLYKLKVDDSFVEPLPVMPWELVKKEVAEDEEREEQQSGSSSSD